MVEMINRDRVNFLWPIVCPHGTCSYTKKWTISGPRQAEYLDTEHGQMLRTGPALSVLEPGQITDEFRSRASMWPIGWSPCFTMLIAFPLRIRAMPNEFVWPEREWEYDRKITVIYHNASSAMFLRLNENMGAFFIVPSSKRPRHVSLIRSPARLTTGVSWSP